MIGSWRSVTRLWNGTLVVGLMGWLAGAPSAAQQVSFEDAVRELRNPDLQTRLTALRRLRDASYPEAAAPIAQLITDVEDAVQLEAIDAELSIFLAKGRTRGGPVVEVRGKDTPQRAYVAGPDALAPRIVPPEVPLALSNALKDRSSPVRLASIFTFGVLAPASPDFRPSTLREAAATVGLMIRQDEAAVREGAALAAGRVWKDCGVAGAADTGCALVGDALIDGMNDRDEGVQLAAMDSLGHLRYAPSVQSLSDRFAFHRTGRAAEIAINSVSRIGSVASAPLFRTLLTDGRDGARVLGIEGLARAGDKASLPDIQRVGGRKPSAEVALAVAYAEQKLGAVPRMEPLVRGLVRANTRPLAHEYLVDLCGSESAALVPYLSDQDPVVRAEVARVFARVGDSTVIPRLEPLLRDPDPRVSEVATLAVARVKARSR